MSILKSSFTSRLAPLLIGAICATASLPGALAGGCPDPSLGETPEDCPWAEIGRALAGAATRGRPVLPVLRTMLPALYSKLVSDSQRGSWLALWGRSINFDEGAREVILEPGIIESFERMFGVPPGARPGRIVHAGIEHTYGYLFSLVRTPFGFKRARWVRPTLDEGFLLPRGTISPLPGQGTLFSNVTYWIGRMAFRDDPRELGILEKDGAAAAAAVRDFHYSRLSFTRLEETVKVPGPGVDGAVGDRIIRLRTDLVPFLRPVQGDPDSHLLVYSVSDPGEGGARLITAFPVERSFVEKVTDPGALGSGKPVTTRYNGYVEGLTGRSLSGVRRILRQ